jgi:hypothetical protein
MLRVGVCGSSVFMRTGKNQCYGHELSNEWERRVVKKSHEYLNLGNTII